MSDDRRSFISRWSRRKRATKEEDESPSTADRQPPPSEAVAAAPAEPGGPAGDTAGDTAGDAIADLPDVETLDESSDFTAFLREGVPDGLRRQALRRLWRLNPVFANVDGLNDYDEDFTNAATVVEGLKSAYRAGRGFVDEAAEGDEPAEPTGAGAAAAPPETEPAPAPDEESDAGAAEQAAEEALPEGPEESGSGAAAAGPRRAPSRAAAPAKPAARRPARQRRWGDPSA